jgi:hypothetical protein
VAASQEEKSAARKHGSGTRRLSGASARRTCRAERSAAAAENELPQLTSGHSSRRQCYQSSCSSTTSTSESEPTSHSTRAAAAAAAGHQSCRAIATHASVPSCENLLLRGDSARSSAAATRFEASDRNWLPVCTSVSATARRPLLAPGGRFYALGPSDEYALDGAVYVQEWVSEAAPGRLSPCLAELTPVAFARCAALSFIGDRLVARD